MVMSQWVALLSDEILNGIKANDNDDDKPVFCKIRHPRSGEGSLFLFMEKNAKVFELLKFDEECRSWLIDQTIQQDGSLYVTTVVNPIFIALPYIIQASKNGNFQLLDQIFTDEDFPEVHRLEVTLTDNDLKKVCDTKGSDFKAYKYNEDSTVSWLKSKVERLSEKLKNKKVKVSGENYADNVVQNPTDEEYLHFAHGMISDYLPVELSERLRSVMGIKAIVHEKPKIEEPTAKRSKKGSKPLEDYSQEANMADSKKIENLTPAQKRLEKVDKKGMKNISAFFSAKPAKTKK